VSDNLRKGAATNAVEIAEVLLERGWIKARSRRGISSGAGRLVTQAERREVLDAIGAEVAVCTRCRLHQTRTKSVPGEGNAETEVMFVGEGPGFNEDRQGLPFVGQAGAKLDALLASVQWTRDEVFITNVVKCRPPENRDPNPMRSPRADRSWSASCRLSTLRSWSLSGASRWPVSTRARIGQVTAHSGRRLRSPVPRKLSPTLCITRRGPAPGSLNETLFRDMLGVPQALLEARRLRESRPHWPAGSAPTQPAAPADSAPSAAPDQSSAVTEPVGADAESDPQTSSGSSRMDTTSRSRHASFDD